MLRRPTFLLLISLDPFGETSVYLCNVQVGIAKSQPSLTSNHQVSWRPFPPPFSVSVFRFPLRHLDDSLEVTE